MCTVSCAGRVGIVPFLEAMQWAGTSENLTWDEGLREEDELGEMLLFGNQNPLWNFSSRNRVTQVSIRDGV